MIHINIGSNLNSKYGTKFDNISIAIKLLIEKKFNVKKISDFYETPSYPNKNLPNFLNVGICGTFTFEVAESKCKLVIDMAKKNQHPLQCTVEKS